MQLPELLELSRHADEPLLTRWPLLARLEKAALFKLLPRSRAVLFFALLPFDEQYFLIGAAPAGTVAPLLEGCSPEERALFHTLTADDLRFLTDTALQGTRTSSSPSPLPSPQRGED